MIRFYAPDILDTNALPADEAAHCVRVLRHGRGDVIEVVDGRGGAFSCRIADIGRRGEVALDILERREEPPHWRGSLTLAIAPTKNADRMEWLVEKAVEMGVDRIVLLRCEHSERKVQKTDRLLRVMVSAMKQSLKAVLPRLEGPVPFGDFIASLKGDDALKLIAHCDDSGPRVDIAGVLVAHDRGADVVVLIGPEGDFSPAEIAEALQAGFRPVTLGRSRLRTETAALFALAALHTVRQLEHGGAR